MNSSPLDAPTNLIPSASVILLRVHDGNLEVLLLQKNQDITFGGSWVFPGGRVDDSDIARSDGAPFSTERNAAYRECLEESGISLVKNRLIPVSEWTTPVIRPKRFRTLFFIYDATFLTDSVVIDHGEIVNYQWIEINEALRLHQSKSLVLAGPAFVQLSQFKNSLNLHDELTRLQQNDLQFYTPRVHLIEGGAVCLYSGDDCYECLNPNAASDDDSTTNSLEKAINRHRLYMYKQAPWEYVAQFTR